MEYNLGTESIIISDQTRKFNDGVYHTVRYNTHYTRTDGLFSRAHEYNRKNNIHR